jgi:formylglycine-generating enzyme required for sulfatase activity
MTLMGKGYFVNTDLPRYIHGRIAILIFFLCFSANIMNAQSRGIEVAARQILGEDVSIGKQWAVFIAVDRYQEWGTLGFPVKDARELKDILTENYFIDEVRELYDADATAANIRKLFVELRGEVGQQDSVFVYYAGHGYLDENTNTGSWIPIDGGQDIFQQMNWLPNIQIRNMLSMLDAQHVFLVSDSCFSGDLLDTNRSASPQINSDYYREAYSRTSRQVMASGSSENVPDMSEFSMRLKNALLQDEYHCIDPEYLFRDVRQVSSTRPQLGYILGSTHQEGGSFLFFRRPVEFSHPLDKAANSIPFRSNSIEQLAEDQKSETSNSLVFVEGGTFTMGSLENEPSRGSDEILHDVTVSSFYMGKYEVTQKEWLELMGNNPSYFKGDTLPVEQVNWNDAIEYCNRRSLKEGLTPAYRSSNGVISCDFSSNGYRLPTEAEWEYAAKGGNKNYLEYMYSGNSDVDLVGWYANNSGGISHAVGEKIPNRLGIYDMSGNVWEWCWDWYGNYPSDVQTDPTGPSFGSDRVGRGGSFFVDALLLRVADRHAVTPVYKFHFLGFRVVRSKM